MNEMSNQIQYSNICVKNRFFRIVSLFAGYFLLAYPSMSMDQKGALVDKISSEIAKTYESNINPEQKIKAALDCVSTLLAENKEQLDVNNIIESIANHASGDRAQEDANRLVKGNDKETAMDHIDIAKAEYESGVRKSPLKIFIEPLKDIIRRYIDIGDFNTASDCSEFAKQYFPEENFDITSAIYREPKPLRWDQPEPPCIGIISWNSDSF